ncbi:hypothetical protein PLEOSDRAFT_1088701 [Pleurotus ostreatus PC15]|uniref:Uncharacterized protein n=1 Tax=Pleurotus ostreatus (strain PC15) TaxID=1137138 RepID=A0A067P4B7_PLEO1|nr:hypothetical protein PLEOSDRAFT_1088701 [Pleurotus ostreatus PC15]
MSTKEKKRETYNSLWRPNFTPTTGTGALTSEQVFVFAQLLVGRGRIRCIFRNSERPFPC